MTDDNRYDEDYGEAYDPMMDDPFIGDDPVMDEPDMDDPYMDDPWEEPDHDQPLNDPTLEDPILSDDPLYSEDDYRWEDEREMDEMEARRKEEELDDIFERERREDLEDQLAEEEELDRVLDEEAEGAREPKREAEDPLAPTEDSLNEDDADSSEEDTKVLGEREELYRAPEQELYRIHLGDEVLLEYTLRSTKDSPVIIIDRPSEPSKEQIYENLLSVATESMGITKKKSQSGEEADFVFHLREWPTLAETSLEGAGAREYAIFHLQVTAALIQIASWLTTLGGSLGTIGEKDITLADNGALMLRTLIYDKENDTLYYQPTRDKSYKSELSYLVTALWNNLNKEKSHAQPDYGKKPKAISPELVDLLTKTMLGDETDLEVVYSALRNEVKHVSVDIQQNKEPENKLEAIKAKLGLTPKPKEEGEQRDRPKQRKKNLPPLPVIVLVLFLVALLGLRLVSVHNAKVQAEEQARIVAQEKAQAEKERRAEEKRQKEEELRQREEEEQAAKEAEEAEEEEREEDSETTSEDDSTTSDATTSVSSADSGQSTQLDERERALSEREQKLKSEQDRFREEVNRYNENIKNQPSGGGTTTVPVQTPAATSQPKQRTGSKADPNESFSVSPSNISLKVGETKELRPNKSCTWSVEDAEVATIKNGVIQAKKKGTTTIIARDQSGATVKITVTVN